MITTEQLKEELDIFRKTILKDVKDILATKTNECVEEKRYEKKLHNTQLLLKNFRKFKKHADQAEFTVSSLIDEKLLESINIEFSDDTEYIKSIMRTKARTATMLNHIIRVLDFYEFSSENGSVDERAAKALKMKYIQNMKIDDMAIELCVDKRTVDRDIKRGIEEISPLLFGIDGMRLE